MNFVSNPLSLKYARGAPQGASYEGSNNWEKNRFIDKVVLEARRRIGYSLGK